MKLPYAAPLILSFGLFFLEFVLGENERNVGREKDDTHDLVDEANYQELKATVEELQKEEDMLESVLRGGSDRVWGPLEDKKYCEGDPEYDSDMQHYPFFWTEHNPFQTLAACKEICETAKDTHGRPCVAINMVATGNGNQKQCQLAWGCDSTKDGQNTQTWRLLPVPDAPTRPRIYWFNRENRRKQCPSGSTQWSGGRVTVNQCMEKCKKHAREGRKQNGRSCNAIEVRHDNRSIHRNRRYACILAWGCGTPQRGDRYSMYYMYSKAG